VTKNNSEAVVNVNLARCDCGGASAEGKHAPDCPGALVLVPLSLEPWRIVTMTVRLGDCRCLNKDRAADGIHAGSCPARPVRVSCSISGDTWEESEVIGTMNSVEVRDCPVGASVLDFVPACRARWSIVKALVTGLSWGDFQHEQSLGERMSTGSLFAQRDAVFAVLTEMVRHENAAALAQTQALKAMDATWIDYGGCPGHHSAMDGRRPSVVLLARYVEKLIEEVGSLLAKEPEARDDGDRP
jgi:hypothetical protein